MVKRDLILLGFVISTYLFRDVYFRTTDDVFLYL